MKGLARPAQRALAQAGFVRLEQFAKVTEDEIAQLHGVGPHGLEKLRAALAAKGIAFTDSKPEGVRSRPLK